MLVKCASAFERFERTVAVYTHAKNKPEAILGLEFQSCSFAKVAQEGMGAMAPLRPSPDTSAARFQRLEFDSLLSATVMLLIATRTSKVIPDAGCMYRDMQRFVLKVLGF